MTVPLPTRRPTARSATDGRPHPKSDFLPDSFSLQRLPLPVQRHLLLPDFFSQVSAAPSGMTLPHSDETSDSTHASDGRPIKSGFLPDFASPATSPSSPHESANPRTEFISSRTAASFGVPTSSRTRSPPPSAFPSPPHGHQSFGARLSPHGPSPLRRLFFLFGKASDGRDASDDHDTSDGTPPLRPSHLSFRSLPHGPFPCSAPPIRRLRPLFGRTCSDRETSAVSGSSPPTDLVLISGLPPLIRRLPPSASRHTVDPFSSQANAPPRDHMQQRANLYGP